LRGKTLEKSISPATLKLRTIPFKNGRHDTQKHIESPDNPKWRSLLLPVTGQLWCHIGTSFAYSIIDNSGGKRSHLRTFDVNGGLQKTLPHAIRLLVNLFLFGGAPAGRCVNLSVKFLSRKLCIVSPLSDRKPVQGFPALQVRLLLGISLLQKRRAGGEKSQQLLNATDLGSKNGSHQADVNQNLHSTHLFFRARLWTHHPPRTPMRRPLCRLPLSLVLASSNSPCPHYH